MTTGMEMGESQMGKLNVNDLVKSDTPTTQIEDAAYKFQGTFANLVRLRTKNTQFPKENPTATNDSQGKRLADSLPYGPSSVIRPPTSPDSQTVPTPPPYNTPSPWPEDDTSAITDRVSTTTSDSGYKTASQWANTRLQLPLVRPSSSGTEGGKTTSDVSGGQSIEQNEGVSDFLLKTFIEEGRKCLKLADRDFAWEGSSPNGRFEFGYLSS